ncbi:hypothetical protein BJX61DRAFT_551441 [Aspergillus egyptiacus]|nr:hypothetical protein BJX61DRAFT_551441 [Aspergillus egyptiacus]
MDDSVWGLYKPDLHRLYIQQNKTLAQVMEYMAAKYSFEETKAQYVKHFKQWGFQKNQKLSESDGIFIGRRINKRKQMFDKESEVHVNGTEYAPRKLQKAPYGKAYVSTIDGLRVPGAPSPDTPEGIVVCTPASPGMRLNWNESLPWLRFSKLLQPGQSEGLPSPVSALAVTSPRETDALSHAMNRELLERLKFVVPWNRLCHPTNVNSSSRTATGLSILMPEEKDGELRALARRFSESRQSTIDSLGIEMFLLSNNLVSHGPKGKTFDSMASHDSRVMKMFRVSGWNSVAQLQVLLTTQEPTAGAIAEQLFASALRSQEIEIVKMMLEAGMSPNGCIDTVDNGSLTPLQFLVMKGGELELIELLLSNGADLDASYDDISVLQYAVEAGDVAVIDLLLSRGARVTPSCLAAAAGSIQDANLFLQFMRPDTDVNARSGWQGPSPLAQAVRGGTIEIISILLSRGADVNALVDIDFDGDWGLTTVLGLAVQSERLKPIEALLHACPDVNPEMDGLPYVSPLALAVASNRDDLRVLELLLQAGVDIHIADSCGKRTLIELALERKNTAKCEALIRHGARIDRPLPREDETSSALVCAIEIGATDIASMLVLMGARLNDVYSNAPGSVLGAAIEKGDPALIQMLQSAGAVVIGPSLRRIGNLETAVYLEESGMLEAILNVSGARILKAALLAKDDRLVHRLLYHSVNFRPSSADARSVAGQVSQETALQAAIRTRRVDFTYAILDRGATVTDCDLAEAVSYRDNDEISDLLQRLLTGFQGQAPTAIAQAVLLDKPNLLHLLLAAGLDPTGKPQKFADYWECADDDDYQLDPPESVLEIVSQSGNRSMLKTLLAARPWDPSLVGRALTLSIFFGHSELVEYLLAWPVDVNQEITIRHLDTEDESGMPVPGYNEIITPLESATKNQEVSVVERLLAHPSIVVDYFGAGARRRTALQQAVATGNMELVNLLLRHGADINAGPARDGGATALQIAAIQGYLGIARRLIDLGGLVNAPPARVNGRTALEGAAEHGRIDMLQMLLNNGASVTDDDGQRQYRRAIEFAERNGHHAAARLLMSFEPRRE